MRGDAPIVLCCTAAPVCDTGIIVPRCEVSARGQIFCYRSIDSPIINFKPPQVFKGDLEIVACFKQNWAVNGIRRVINRDEPCPASQERQACLVAAPMLPNCHILATGRNQRVRSRLEEVEESLFDSQGVTRLSPNAVPTPGC